jgi:hypothetical protein
LAGSRLSASQQPPADGLAGPTTAVSRARAAPTAGASPTPAPAPTGRAAFGGTWSGTVSEPGWTAPTWTIELVIPASGKDGSYSAPSLGCSGTLTVPKTAVDAMAAVAKTTSTVNAGCVAKAKLTLTLSGSGEMSMTWVPAKVKNEIGTALLARG